MSSRASQIPGAREPFAPTPQNTPLNTTTPSALSRPQVPTTLQEDDESEDIPTINTAGTAGKSGRADVEQLTSNPLFTEMVQGRLASLMGKSSGYIESLPPAVRQRIDGLKGLQAKQTEIEAEFQHEILALEKRFAARYAPLYDQRARIIAGLEEPSADLVVRGRELDDELEDEDEDEMPKPAVKATGTNVETKGVPEFWLTALKNHLGLSEQITERDEGVLRYLADVRVVYLEGKPGFKIVFTFDQGAMAFFSNKTLEKTYVYNEKIGYEGDFVYDHAEGTDIKWKDGKDLTKRMETKKQRNKNTGQTRVVTKQIKTDSFFDFFTPPVPPESDDESVDDDIAERLELDYQIGEDFKERIIPRAVDHFTGKNLEHEDVDLSDDPDDDDFDEEDDSDEDQSEALQPPGVRKAKQPPLQGITPSSGQEPQECKQQ